VAIPQTYFLFVSLQQNFILILAVGFVVGLSVLAAVLVIFRKIRTR
jgi:hypothetical protein